MRPVLAAALSQSKQPCYPEAAEPLARERLPSRRNIAACSMEHIQDAHRLYLGDEYE
jgi:hypothetical protein